ncbi:MAG: hypothetical protein ABEJ40_06175 [Haloarculaceae archaeon]
MDTGGPASPEVLEVDWRAVRRLVAGVGEHSGRTRAARRVLSDRGLAPPLTRAWYPLTAFLDAIDALEPVVGPDGVSALGRRHARGVGRDGPDSVPDALDALDRAYRRHHRGGDPGGYAFRRIGDADGRVECRTPYPRQFDRGIVQGVADAGADGYVCLSEIGVCRSGDGVRCTYELSW